MAAVTDPQGEGFRLGMLWTDGRYRSVTIQIIALMLVMLGVSFLVNNVVANLADLGKTFDFGFMAQPSSYDINQRLIEYDSRSSHATAAVVGILNTLLIAFMGCIAATVIGVVAGVARLSNNWIVAAIMTVYVEVVRNIPLLVQILLFSAVFVELLPSPRQSEISTLFGWETGIVATNRGFYIPAPVWHAGSSFVIVALFAGIVGSIWYARHARRVQQATGDERPVGLVRLALILGLPIGVFLLVWMVQGAPITLAAPELQGFNYRGGIHMR
ncbi:MAG: ABC transporter permease subunit, partial [Pseudomonadota bacterium]